MAARPGGDGEPMGTFVSRRALVYGATGLIGRELVQQLLADPRYSSVLLLLRRAAGSLPANPKLHWQVVDFERLPKPFPAVDDVYCCIGTTIKVAGSREAFRAVDFDLVVNTARTARRAGAQRLAVVSALGADPKSSVFYNRTKGEMESAVSELGYASVVIARPSLLTGDRAATGLPERPAERWVTALVGPVSKWVPARWRPIEAGVVARALRAATAAAPSGLRFIESSELQTLGR